MMHIRAKNGKTIGSEKPILKNAKCKPRSD
jgi:hypothetical protein